MTIGKVLAMPFYLGRSKVLPLGIVCKFVIFLTVLVSLWSLRSFNSIDVSSQNRSILVSGRSVQIVLATASAEKIPATFEHNESLQLGRTQDISNDLKRKHSGPLQQQDLPNEHIHETQRSADGLTRSRPGEDDLPRRDGADRGQGRRESSDNLFKQEKVIRFRGYKQMNARLLQELQHPQQLPLQFMLVTGERPHPCKTSLGSQIVLKSYKNKVDYCNLHSCKVWFILETWEEGFAGTWARYPVLLRLMRSNPSIEWFMWMDADAIFTDLNFSIPFQTYSSWGKNLIIPGYWKEVYGEIPDWVGLNAGIFLIRNCPWSYNFLHKWQLMGLPESREKVRNALNAELKSRPREWDPDDQSVLIYLLRKTKHETGNQVFLESGYTLHGYWDFIVDKYEDFLSKGRRDQWPFVTHFCGCNFCGGDTISQRCHLGFDRAFHFANNQMLALVNLQHTNLNTSLLSPLTHST